MESPGAQAYMTGSFPLTIETPGAIARQVVNAVFMTFTRRAATYRQRVAAVTPDDVSPGGAQLHPARSPVDCAGWRTRGSKTNSPRRGSATTSCAFDALDLSAADFKKRDKIMIPVGEPSGDLTPAPSQLKFGAGSPTPPFSDSAVNV